MAQETFPQPSEKAIEWLKTNPNRASDFDIKFGQGAAATILNPQVEAPVAPQETQAANQPDGWLADTAKGLVEGVLGAVRETGQFIDQVDTSASKFLDKKIGGSTLYYDGRDSFPISFGTQQEAQDALAAQGLEDKRLGDVSDQLRIFDEDRDTLVGGFAQGATQFITGLMGAGKLLKLNIGTVKGATIGGFVADSVAFDPNDANLVKVLDEQFNIGVDVVTEALANNETDDQFLNRLKNGVVGTAIGLPLDIGVAIYRGVRVRNKARTELAETGKVSDATQAEAEEIEGIIENFSQLQQRGQKPKGKFTDDRAMFITDDGMVFDVVTGIRKPDIEKSLLNKSDAPIKFSDAPEAPSKPNIGDATDAIPTPKVDTVAPDQPIAPKTDRPPNRRPFKKAALVNVVEEIRKNPEKLMEVDELVNDRFVFNPKYFQGPRNPEAILTATAKELEAQGLFKRAGISDPDTWKAHTDRTVTMLAEELNVSEKSFRANLRRVAKTAEEQVQWMTAGKIEMTRLIKEIEATADQIDKVKATGNNPTDLYNQYLDLMEQHADIQLSVQGIRTATGRALNLNKLEINPQVSDAALSKLEELGGDIHGSAKVDKLIAQFRAAKTKRQRNAILRGQVSWKNKFFGVAGETFINNILSSPTAHALNVGASSINLVARPAIKLAGARDKETAKRALLEEYYTVTTLLESLKIFDTTQGLRLNDNSAIVSSMRSFVSGSSVLDSTDKLASASQGRMMSSEYLGLKGTPLQDLVDGFGILTTMTSRVLATEDQFFKHLSYRANVKANAVVDAGLMSVDELTELGYEGSLKQMRKQYVSDEVSQALNTKEVLTERYNQMVLEGRAIEDPTMLDAYIKRNLGSYNNSSKYAESALNEARAVTFTTPLGRDSFMYGLNNWVRAQPVLRQIVPFVQTPTNVLRENFERVPLINNFMSGLKRDMMSPDPQTAALARGKFAYGWGMTMAALYFAYNDRITGSGPSYALNPKLAKQWNDSPDWQPNSLVFERDDGSVKFYDISKLLPHFGAFTLIGSFNEYIKRGDLTDDEVSLYLGGLVSTFASQVTMQSSLSGVSDFMRIMSGDAAPWEIESFFAQRSATMIPYSGLSYYLNRENDGVMRDLKDFDELIKSRIWDPIVRLGGQEREAPVQYDWLTGRPKNSPDYVYGFVKTKVVGVSDKQIAEVAEELRKIDKPLSAPDRREFGKELSPDVFQEFNKLVGTVVDNNGKNLIQDLHTMINSPLYDKAGKRQPYGVSDFRRDLLNSTLNKYKGLATRELIKKLPHLEDVLRGDAKVLSELMRGNMPENTDRLDERLDFQLNN